MNPKKHKNLSSTPQWYNGNNAANLNSTFFKKGKVLWGAIVWLKDRTTLRAIVRMTFRALLFQSPREAERMIEQMIPLLNPAALDGFDEPLTRAQAIEHWTGFVESVGKIIGADHVGTRLLQPTITP
jgi:hypothetical protein